MYLSKRSSLAFVLILLCLSSCSLTAGGASMVWIDAPLDGSEIELGSTVLVHAHANHAAGIAEMLLLINGTAYRREAPLSPGEEFTEIDLIWNAEEAGVFTIIVEAVDNAGNSVRSTPVTVTVLEGALQSIPGSPTELSATFAADLDSLTAGQCTILRWQTTNAVSVMLDGVTVAPVDTKLVCPSADSTYHLLASGETDSVVLSVTIKIIQPLPPTIPPDSAGPSISSVSHSPDFIWDGTSCGPNTATITVSVSDPSGIGSVTLYYRVVRSGTPGSWQTMTMSYSGGGYTSTLGPAELMASINPYTDGVVEYYIRAQDTLGNTSQSSTFQFEARLCFG